MDIENLKIFWDEIQEIDKSCWVLEPITPSLQDCMRRIFLSNIRRKKINFFEQIFLKDHNVSITINVDPRNPREMPEIVFLGSHIC